MKYILIYSLFALTACQVNFNLFPKFEGRKKDEKAIGYSSVKAKEWEQYADMAAKLNPMEPAELVVEPIGVIPSDIGVISGNISTETITIYDDFGTTTSPDTCTHYTILATASKDGYYCSCWDCGTLWECEVKAQ